MTDEWENEGGAVSFNRVDLHKGEIYRVKCISIFGVEKYTFYMIYDGEKFLDGAIDYDVDDLVIQEKVGFDFNHPYIKE